MRPTLRSHLTILGVLAAAGVAFVAVFTPAIQAQIDTLMFAGVR